MNDALTNWLNTFEQQSLPAISVNCELLQQLFLNEHSDMEQLAIVIESDPGLSVLLLRHINQLRHQQQRSEITTPRHALMMMGMEPLRELLSNVTTSEVLSEEQHHRLCRCFNQAFHAASQARMLGQLRHDRDIEELYTTTLLNSLGETLLSLHAPEEVDKVYALLQQNGMDEEEAQKSVFGFSFNQLTLELARVWQLPELLAESLQAENNEDSRIRTITLAIRLVRTATHGWYNQTMNALIEELAEFIATDSAALASRIHYTAVEAAHESVAFPAPHPAALLLLPATDPALEAADTLVAVNTPRAMTGDEPESASEPYLAPQPRILLKTLKVLNDPGDKLAAKEIIRLALQGMHDGLGLDRVVFATPDSNKKQLRASLILGGENSPSFKRFAVDLGNHNLFSRLMEKPQALWLDDHNRKKFFSLIPINFHKLIDNDSFFVMALFVKNNPVGLFYADRDNRNNRLDEESYQRFKQIVTLTGKALGSQ